MKYIDRHMIVEQSVSRASNRREPYRIIAVVRERIRCLVETDDLMEAVETLLELADLCTPHKSNEASLLKRQVTAVERDVRINIINREQASIERNRLAMSILEMTQTY